MITEFYFLEHYKDFQKSIFKNQHVFHVGFWF